MADTVKPMYEGQPGTTTTLLYTAPAAGAVVKSIIVVNTTGTAATITLGIANAAGALAAANYLLPVISIPPNTMVSFDIWRALLGSGTIRALQGTASALTVHISGIEQ